MLKYVCQIWARKCGFNIASEITEFKNSNLKMRIILCDIPESKDIQCGIPNNEEVIGNKILLSSIK